MELIWPSGETPMQRELGVRTTYGDLELQDGELWSQDRDCWRVPNRKKCMKGNVVLSRNGVQDFLEEDTGQE